jgi:hypothetical protein
VQAKVEDFLPRTRDCRPYEWRIERDAVRSDRLGDDSELLQEGAVMESQTLTPDTMESELAALDGRAAEVYAWRFEQLERAGYTAEHALALAEDHRVDLHKACDLVRRGCPERTVYLIMA